MDISAIFLISLRVLHALAATVWLGGGIYYLVAVRPAAAELESGGETARRTQQLYASWSRPATYLMLATGTILIVDRLSQGQGGLLYPILLALKVIAALVAFWLIAQRTGRRRGRRTRGEIILLLGAFAFIMGIVLTSVWPPTN